MERSRSPAPEGGVPGAGPVMQLSLGAGPDNAASKFAAVIARSANAPTALIHLTEDGTLLHLAGAAGMPAGWARIGPTPASSTLAGLVIENDHPFVIADIAEDPRVPRNAPALALGVRGYAGFPIRDPQRRVVGVCTVLDFQPRQWTPNELAAVDEATQTCTAFVAEQRRADTHRRFLDALLQSLQTGVAACDEDGRLVFTNEAIRRLSGPMPVGAGLRECAERSILVDAQGRPLRVDDLPLSRALNGEQLHDVDLTVAAPGKPVRTVSADARPIVGADGRRLGAVVAVRDVTDRRRAEELTLALARSKDEYLALIGHELRTPLTCITAYVEMLREADPGTVADELPCLLDVLSRNSAALRRIVDQLLDLAALDGGHAELAREPVDLTATVRAAARTAEPVATAAGVSIALDLCRGATVAGDAARLRQMAEQLLDNSVKHTIGGGRVTVTLTRPDPAAIELTITDTGVGVPGDDRDRLFAPFYRSRRTREHGIPGNGLGLATCRAIVERHCGSIRLIPVPEPGARVTVRLPSHASP